VQVDISKVNMEVMMKWIVKRVTELLGMEDEVLCGFIEGLLQEKASCDTLSLLGHTSLCRPALVRSTVLLGAAFV
jgi:hypothetical protein